MRLRILLAIIRGVLLGVILESFPFCVRAQVFWYPPFYCSSNDTSVTITSYVGPGGTVNIPSTIVGLPVTGIGNSAFYRSFHLSGVTIPDSVVSIGTNAFGYCTNLTSVAMGTNLTFIEDKAFYNCTKLPTVTIPIKVTTIGANAFGFCTNLVSVSISSSVTNIGTGAFANCPSLTGITVDPLNPVYSSVDGVLFNQIQTMLMQYPQGRTGQYTIPDGVRVISDYAFQYCGGLTGISIPSSVTNMGNSTFQYCANLISAVLGSNVTSIGISAFFSCPSLVNVTVPYGLTTIGDAAFEYCGSLTNFVMPNSVTNTGNWTFEYCTNLASAHLSTNITAIGDALFMNCQNLKGITIPNGVVTIGAFAFGNDIGITCAIIPNSVTSIGGWAFNACSLTTLSIGNSVTNIGQRAFLGCSTLTTSVTIPSSVTYIGDYGFAVCFRVPAFFFQGNPPTVGPDAFWDDFNTTGYYLPGTSGWTNTLDALSTVLWNPEIQTMDGSFGVRNNQFGFNIIGTTNIPIVVEARTTLANDSWTPLQSCIVTDGRIYFTDPQYPNFSSRIYRIRSP
jgi:hypothetical protein